MYWGLIHRMILMELIKIFVVSLIALTGLILMAGVIAEAMKSGLSPVQIATAIPLMLPSMLPYTIPTTTLFATCIVYGRLSSDNEILALKAAGVHIVHIIWPALLLGLFASAATMFLYLDTIPVTHFLMRSQFTGDVEDLLYTMLRKDSFIKHPKINYEIHVKSMKGRKLYDVLFLRRASDGNGFDIIAKAREAELHVSMSERKIEVLMRNAQMIQGSAVILVEEKSWPVELPPDFASPGKSRTAEMTWNELIEFEKKMTHEKKELGDKIDKHLSAIHLGKGQPHFDQHARNLINERRTRDMQLFAVDSEQHMRPALALGCFCFALIGCPIGIWFSKSDYLSAFITCFLPIVTLYYPLMLGMVNLTRAGKFPSMVGLYAANVLMLIAGVWLFQRLARN